MPDFVGDIAQLPGVGLGLAGAGLVVDIALIQELYGVVGDIALQHRKAGAVL